MDTVRRVLLALVVALGLSSCNDNYSPNVSVAYGPGENPVAIKLHGTEYSYVFITLPADGRRVWCLYYPGGTHWGPDLECP